MPGILGGSRPDLTPAQLAAGVPILANFAHAFGMFTLSPEQTTSLHDTIAYGLALITADAVVRVGRNLRDARVEAAQAAVAPVAPAAPAATG